MILYCSGPCRCGSCPRYRRIGGIFIVCHACAELASRVMPDDVDALAQTIAAASVSTTNAVENSVGAVVGANLKQKGRQAHSLTIRGQRRSVAQSAPDVSLNAPRCCEKWYSHSASRSSNRCAVPDGMIQ